MAESSATSLAELNIQIIHHVEVLQRLRARRNERVSWTPRLPIDVFREILTVYRDSELPSYRSNYYSSHRTGLQNSHSAVPWIAPSQVCQHWRIALLDYAAFWAVLPLNNIKWTDLLLIRSKDAPLTLRPVFNSVQGAADTHRESFYLALRESHRIVHLVISLPEIIDSPRHESFAIKTFLLCSFAQLRTLRINSSRYTMTPPPPVYGGYVPFSPKKFLRKINQWLPYQLSSLRICATSISTISLTIQSNLTQLEVVDEGGSFGHLSVNMLLHFLGRLPVLEDLILRCTLNHDIEDHILDRCVLGYLKFMGIDSMDTPLLTLSALIGHIEGPSTLRIAITSTFLHAANGALTGTSETNEVSSLTHDLTNASCGAIQQLFSSLSPYLNSQDSQIENSLQLTGKTFRSMFIETCYWSLTIALSRTGKLDLKASLPFDEPNSFPWKGLPLFNHSDVHIELQDTYRLQARYRLPQPGQGVSDRPLLYSNDVLPSTLELLLASQHIFLSETPECQMRGSDLNVHPWVNGLISAIHLRDLELRVSEQTLQFLLYVLDGWKDRSQPDAEMTLPCLEYMTFWEFRFQSQSPFSTPILPFAIDLTSQHEPPLPNIDISPQTPGSQHSNSYILDPFTLASTISGIQGRTLIDSLADRQKAGYPVRKLSFRLCFNFSLAVVREYEKVANEVVWDGINHEIMVPVAFDDALIRTPSPQEDSEDSLTGSEAE
ncbi:hypothetical protein DL96DRAFT_1590050 [Flagelloscypha sp. PMI_526]|nr:hypothetical protein DL96DRAFT_1590050 [Flagelloscypha sp. PMI_526]